MVRWQLCLHKPRRPNDKCRNHNLGSTQTRATPRSNHGTFPRSAGASHTFGLYGGPLHAQDAITVDVTSTIADVSRRPFGINLNFLLDDDENRPAALKKLAAGLRAAGVKYLRYPGGEKADGYLWSVPPYTSSIPTLARWAPGEWPGNTEWPLNHRWLVEHDGFTLRTNPLNFDEFMDICRQIDCVPTIVVCYDSMYKPAQPGGFAPSRATVLEAAREWVRYANVTRGYNVQDRGDRERELSTALQRPGVTVGLRARPR